MANFDEYGRRERVELTSFGGLNRLGPLCGGKDSFELRNLRRLPDGTLQRREGFIPLVTFPDVLRGGYCVERRDGKECYAVAGRWVYALREVEGVWQSTPLAQLGTETGNVHFFCHEGLVYLLDGEEMWSLSPEAAFLTVPYIPLYGKDWSTSESDERNIYETPSMLTDLVRIRFHSGGNPTRVYFHPLYPKEIVCVWRNGVKIEEGYTWYPKQSMITFDVAQGYGTVIEVLVRLPDELCNDRTAVCGAGQTVTVGDATTAQIMLFGGSVRRGGIWVTREPDAAEAAYLPTLLPKSRPFYITRDDLLMPGDGVSAVTGICRHYDRFLIFMNDGTWMMTGLPGVGEGVTFYPVNSSLGCTPEGGCALVGNSPYTVFRGRVLRWNSRSDERDECNGEVVSSVVEPLMGQMLTGNVAVFGDARRGEIWFYEPGKEGRVLVRQDERGTWTTLDGFTPTDIFAMGNQVAFCDGNTLYCFDDAAQCDRDASGREVGISCEYMSQFLDIGLPGRQKRLLGVTVCADCGDAPVELILGRVSGRTRTETMRGKGDEISVMQCRGGIGRFRFLRVGVRSAGIGPFRLHRLDLAVDA